MRVLLLAAVFLIAGCAPASGALLRPYEERVHVDTPCPAGGEGSCVMTPDIYLAEGAGRFELWHERGHLFDAQVLTDAQRAWFTRMLKMEGPWDQGTGMGTRGPSEVFADAYATCAIGPQPVRAKGAWAVSNSDVAYGYDVGPRRHRRICTAISVVTWIRFQELRASAG
jgi:hypothetical protein